MVCLATMRMVLQTMTMLMPMELLLVTRWRPMVTDEAANAMVAVVVMATMLLDADD